MDPHRGAVRTKKLSSKVREARCGAVAVKLYRESDPKVGGNYVRFRLAYSEPGPGRGRQRRSFASEEDALREAELTARRLANGQFATACLNDVDAQCLADAKLKLAPFNLSLTDALSEFVHPPALLRVGKFFNGPESVVVSKGADLRFRMFLVTLISPARKG